MTTEEPLDLCLSGEISPEVALARMLLLGATPDVISAIVRRRGLKGEAWRGLPELLSSKRSALTRLAAEVAGGVSDHATLSDSEGGTAAIAAFFDRAVAHSPEASVALYSLADPVILAAATEEIVTWLRARNLLGGDVLDLGCGIGRIAARLATECRSIFGLDVSEGMIAEATRRHGSLTNVRFAHTSGRNLDAVIPGSIDLVLAVDSFPYIVQIGDTIAQAHIVGAARSLKPDGSLVILNVSYRGDDGQDVSDITRWAKIAGLVMVEAATRPYALWDGAAYRLEPTAY